MHLVVEQVHVNDKTFFPLTRWMILVWISFVAFGTTERGGETISGKVRGSSFSFLFFFFPTKDIIKSKNNGVESAFDRSTKQVAIGNDGFKVVPSFQTV